MAGVVGKSLKTHRGGLSSLRADPLTLSGGLLLDLPSVSMETASSPYALTYRQQPLEEIRSNARG